MVRDTLNKERYQRERRFEREIPENRISENRRLPSEVSESETSGIERMPSEVSESETSGIERLPSVTSERVILENEKVPKEKLQTINNNDNTLPKTPTLVIAKTDFDDEEYNHLDFEKDEFLIVTNWNYGNGWVEGHRKDNEEEKGIFLKELIKIYEGNF